MLRYSKNNQASQFLMNRQKKIKQAAQFLINFLRNYELCMLNFAKSEKFIREHDLETESMILKVIDLKVKSEKILMFNFHCKNKSFLYINLGRNFRFLL